MKESRCCWKKLLPVQVSSIVKYVREESRGGGGISLSGDWLFSESLDSELWGEGKPLLCF